jgi:hypothetical protein
LADRSNRHLLGREAQPDVGRRDQLTGTRDSVSPGFAVRGGDRFDAFSGGGQLHRVRGELDRTQPRLDPWRVMGGDEFLYARAFGKAGEVSTDVCASADGREGEHLVDVRAEPGSEQLIGLLVGDAAGVDPRAPPVKADRACAPYGFQIGPCLLCRVGCYDVDACECVRTFERLRRLEFVTVGSQRLVKQRRREMRCERIRQAESRSEFRPEHR